MSADNLRTFGGSGRHALSADAIGQAHDAYILVSHHGVAPLGLHPSRVSPTYVGRHRIGYGTTDYRVDAIAHRVDA